MNTAGPLFYRIVAPPADAARGPLADEALLALGVDGAVGCIWQAPQGLVVPRTYAAHPGFGDVRAELADQGWPVHIRQSGGGVVPQGPGILNISLAQRFTGRPLDHADAFYRHLCALLQASLFDFGIEARAQAVEGSFCDGRYNLAVGSPARKVAGTAQLWRHIPGRASTQQIGIVHAMILAQCDTALATARANQLETALGSGRRYQLESVDSLDRWLPNSRRPGFCADLQHDLLDRLRTWPAL
ncbi:MAG: lipoate--protein ligase family protein [Castellaniella sp.]|uniref:lipoyl protein ligase domain-containing protein n=1 Tax=Castellaniella sp. TaxID=1955812 RepID=UPI001215FAC8|nr:lipoate--protein ligase family protein [Castellaniella sp.]TAN27690.1 MAG: lipoate--protein ligase family protein [Castellaniella sp.]